MEGIMGMLSRIFGRPEKIEARSSGTGYTGLIMAARESYISGASGLAELSAAVQSSVSLWEGGFALADVKGTDLLTRRVMAITARALALRGEAVFLINGAGLVACSDWDLQPVTASRALTGCRCQRRAAVALRRHWRQRCCTSASGAMLTRHG